MDVEKIQSFALATISEAIDVKTLENLRVQLLGKKGQLTELLKGLGQMEVQQRKMAGQALNIAKQSIQDAITARRLILEQKLSQDELQKDQIDVSLPGIGIAKGYPHPLAMTQRRIEAFFRDAGFKLAQGPEIEDDYHNFAALNIPKQHPARDMQDTFYFPSGLVLRTQTSSVQIREMEQSKPPFRFIAAGKVYRSDAPDLTHSPMFHQVEGLMVDEHINFANLKSILNQFLHYFFQQDLPTRFRPSYFPFTEPSAEVDIGCVQCQGKGCRICSHTGWIEILGCGMVHPNVFNHVGIDSERYTGFAFGMGIERLAMLRYGVTDIRLFYENDIRFLSQFG